MGKQSRRKRDRRPSRTRSGLMAEVLAAASGRPVESVGALLAAFRASCPGFRDAEIPEDEYRRLRAGLMGELPGIRAWLARGADRAAADPARLREFERALASMN